MSRSCPTCRRRLDAFGHCRPCGEAKWRSRAAAVARVPASREVMDEHVRRILTRAAHVDPAARVATHESAHAVCAWALGLTVRDVSADPRGGRTRFSAEGVPADWSPTHDAAVLLAGTLAERRWCGDSAESADDQAALHELVDAGGVDLAEARRLADDILDRHAEDVRRLAGALVDQGHLDDAEVAALLTNRPDEAPTDVRRIAHYAGPSVAGEIRHRRWIEYPPDGPLPEGLPNRDAAVAWNAMHRAADQHDWGRFTAHQRQLLDLLDVRRNPARG